MSGCTGGNLACMSQLWGHSESPYSCWHTPLISTAGFNWESLVRYWVLHATPSPALPFSSSPPSFGVHLRCWGHQGAHGGRDDTADILQVSQVTESLGHGVGGGQGHCPTGGTQEGGKDTVLQDAGVPWPYSDGVTVCPHLTAMGVTSQQGQRHGGNPSHLGEGTGQSHLPHSPI